MNLQLLWQLMFFRNQEDHITKFLWVLEVYVLNISPCVGKVIPLRLEFALFDCLIRQYLHSSHRELLLILIPQLHS